MVKYTGSSIRMWSRLGPSGAFGAAAMELGGSNDNVAVVSADMTFASGLERFKKKYSNRHFEVGIAEQNLVGVAAGLANEGFTTYVTTYATFLATRALDQVKMTLGYMERNVKMVGMFAGFGAGILGPTHMGIEDVAIMRAIPNLTVLSPADGLSMVKMLIAIADMDAPTYIRMTGMMNMPIVYKEDYDFDIGKAVTLKEGVDVAIVATGSMVHQALKAADLLSEKGISCTVVDMHTVKPLDVDCVEELMKKHRLLVTAEEHSVVGGLGGAIAEEMVKNVASIPLLRIGVQDFYPHAADYEYLLKECGMTAEQIAERVKNKLSEMI